MKKPFLLFVIFCFFAADVLAQNFAANPTAVIQQIALGNGPVTKEEYDKFWQTVGVTSKADRQKMIQSMRAGFLLAQEYQKEVWTCIEKSWTTRIAAKCEKADQKLAVMKAAMNNEQVDVVKKMDETSRRMMQAAAKHEDFKISDSATPLKLDLQNIRLIKQNLERMLDRLNQVLRAEY